MEIVIQNNFSFLQPLLFICQIFLSPPWVDFSTAIHINLLFSHPTSPQPTTSPHPNSAWEKKVGGCVWFWMHDPSRLQSPVQGIGTRRSNKGGRGHHSRTECSGLLCHHAGCCWIICFHKCNSLYIVRILLLLTVNAETDISPKIVLQKI